MSTKNLFCSGGFAAKRTWLVLSFLMLTPVLFSQESAFWQAKLWLSGQAFKLDQDCRLGALFNPPVFRSIPQKNGLSISSRLVSQQFTGDSLVLTIETFQGQSVLARTRLDLRLHPAEGVVSVDGMEVDDKVSGKQSDYHYSAAVADDEDWDEFTDTLVGLYTTFFDRGSLKL